MLSALVVFIITYVFVAASQVPRIHVNRPAGAPPEGLITGLPPIPAERSNFLGIRVITLALGVAILTLQATVASGAEAVREGRGGPAMLSIVSADATRQAREFEVVLFCDTVESRARGLQGFRRLARNEAALFVLDAPQHATFWMGSVSYPIDIVFVDRAGKVVRVHRSCEPGSGTVYPSGQPVQWVIETAAGSGIGVGDGVTFR